MFSKERAVELQAKQQQILVFIEEAVRSQGYPPTVREIGAAVGLSSPASVQGHLGTLESLGYIRRGCSKRRALEVIRRPDDTADTVSRGPNSVCLLGRVAAGKPILADENIEDYLDLPSFLVSGRDCFALRVAGTSMVNAGILDGDLVVVRQQQSADDGDIVVAMLEDEATVKRFFRESDRVRLQPENDSMEPIYARDPLILGKVTGVLRRL
jgi:repressor LexA